MASRHRVENLSRPGYFMKMSRAEKAIRECSADWVEFGVSIRNLTIAEAIVARNVQARMREPLAYAEIHGLVYEPCVNGVDASRLGRQLMWDASEFARLAA